jgi:hypothetical protein
VPKRHYQVSTYRVQNSIGYLMTRAHPPMLDVLEPRAREARYNSGALTLQSTAEPGIAAAGE